MQAAGTPARGNGAGRDPDELRFRCSGPVSTSWGYGPGKRSRATTGENGVLEGCFARKGHVSGGGSR